MKLKLISLTQIDIVDPILNKTREALGLNKNRVQYEYWVNILRSMDFYTIKYI